jgi:hypothetical protein
VKETRNEMQGKYIHQHKMKHYTHNGWYEWFVIIKLGIIHQVEVLQVINGSRLFQLVLSCWIDDGNFQQKRN